MYGEKVQDILATTALLKKKGLYGRKFKVASIPLRGIAKRKDREMYALD